jgi:polysaccharide biosynthesis/export protein
MTSLTRLSLVFLALIVVGCTSPRSNTPNALGPRGVFQHAGWHGVTTRPYRIDPPDEIRIRAPKVPELDGQTVVVKPDGNITLPLLGSINLAGASPEEALDKIKTATMKYYVAPDMQIEILARSKFIYIFGPGVGRPGKLEYIGRTTVINVLADAGITENAWPTQVTLNRPGRNGLEDATVVIDFEQMAQYGDLSQNYLVEEGDVVYVPYHPLVQWNQNLSRVLNPILLTVSAAQTPATVVRTYDDVSGNRR